MATTTIRVDEETHARLLDMSREAGDSLVHTVKQAADALSRQRFAQRVSAQLDELRTDEKSWREYLDDADATDVADGIG